MAKANKVFAGSNTFGKSIEVAQSETGTWFWRDYGWNGFSNAWSKWAVLDKEPVHPTRIKYGVECAGAPEYYEIPKEEQGYLIEWGFKHLRLVPGPYRYRLPNN